MQHILHPLPLVLINWEVNMYHIKQAYNLKKEPKTL